MFFKVHEVEPVELTQDEPSFDNYIDNVFLKEHRNAPNFPSDFSPSSDALVRNV